jgi:murein DD-endopeptidase MepM/ murein hydrolase activator NlpD
MRHKFTIAALAAVLILGSAGPVGADTLAKTRQQRDAARAKKAQLAAQINTLKATDTQLTAAAQALNAQVERQMARASDALQAVKAALAQQAEAQAKLQAIEGNIASLRGAVVSRALDAYVRPQGDAAQTYGTDDINQMGRTAVLMSTVSGEATDLLDQLRVQRLDLTNQQAALKKARELADQRRQQEQDRLNELASARSAQSKIQSALEGRIRDYQQEADQVAGQEAALSGLIRTKEAANRASRGGDGSVDGRISGAGLIWPCSGPVTSPFGMRWGRMHQGIDIGCGYGTPIHAAKAGTVIFAGQMSGYGNVIIVDHGGGFSTLYAHQSRLGASDGQSVSQGEVIGYVGSTGHSTGPHLHFETRVDGNPQNPRNYLP